MLKVECGNQGLALLAENLEQKGCDNEGVALLAKNVEVGRGNQGLAKSFETGCTNQGVALLK